MTRNTAIVSTLVLTSLLHHAGCSKTSAVVSEGAEAMDRASLQGEWMASVSASTSRDFPYLLKIEDDTFERVHIFMSCDASMTVTKERGRLVETERGLEVRLAEIEFQTTNHQGEPCGETSAVTPPDGVFDLVRMVDDAFVIETIEGDLVTRSSMYRRRDGGDPSPNRDRPTPEALVPALLQPRR